MLRMVSYPHRPQSGHITCYLNRTYHVLPTAQPSLCPHPNVKLIEAATANSPAWAERSQPKMYVQSKSRAPDLERTAFTKRICVREDSMTVQSAAIELIFAALSNRRHSQKTTGCSESSRTKSASLLVAEFPTQRARSLSCLRDSRFLAATPQACFRAMSLTSWSKLRSTRTKAESLSSH